MMNRILEIIYFRKGKLMVFMLLTHLTTHRGPIMACSLLSRDQAPVLPAWTSSPDWRAGPWNNNDANGHSSVHQRTVLCCVPTVAVSFDSHDTVEMYS